jgi:hypothetical protein
VERPGFRAHVLRREGRWHDASRVRPGRGPGHQGPRGHGVGRAGELRARGTAAGPGAPAGRGRQVAGRPGCGAAAGAAALVDRWSRETRCRPCGGRRSPRGRWRPNWLPRGIRYLPIRSLSCCGRRVSACRRRPYRSCTRAETAPQPRHPAEAVRVLAVIRTAQILDMTDIQARQVREQHPQQAGTSCSTIDLHGRSVTIGILAIQILTERPQLFAARHNTAIRSPLSQTIRDAAKDHSR